MKRLIQRFSEFANRRLRKSQIKILYQNQGAADFLLEQMSLAMQAGTAPQHQMVADLELMKMVTDNAVVSLTYQDTLPEHESRQLLEMNKGLRNVYAGIVEGKRQAKAMMGQDATDLMPFEQRFMPAAGWDNFSDTEWDRMVSKALEGPEK